MAAVAANDSVKDLLSSLRKFFPLKDVESVVLLFKEQMKNGDPNLVALSLVTGFIEHELTNKTKCQHGGLILEEERFPVLTWETFKEMFQHFMSLLETKLKHLHKEGTDETEEESKDSIEKPSYSDRQQVKEIADFVWSQLSTSYFKDRPHLQSVYSFLNGNRLDCFGVALLVIATAQCCRCNDIHLALSEDHAWVTFGKDNESTAEVTWHGKRDEVKRGSPISQDSLVGFSKDWLYLGGNGMNCDRNMEVAAIVSSLNPGVNSKTDSAMLSRLQQELLWLLFDHGHLDRFERGFLQKISHIDGKEWLIKAGFPMAICNLADLEEIQESRQSPSVEDLYEKAIAIAEIEYSGYHVYPYTYYGGYLFRRGMYSKATEMWCGAATAASRYTHSREDEELYKDLHEIANTFFPTIAKQCKVLSSDKLEKVCDRIYFDSEENFLNIINFYDGVCSWEEDGCTAAIHSEWARNFVKLLSCFPHSTRICALEAFAKKRIPNEGKVENEDHSNFPKSQKMKLLMGVIKESKINAQAVNLHLASQVGLASGSKQSSRRSADFVYSLEESAGRSKRYKF